MSDDQSVKRLLQMGSRTFILGQTSTVAEMGSLQGRLQHFVLAGCAEVAQWQWQLQIAFSSAQCQHQRTDLVRARFSGKEQRSATVCVSCHGKGLHWPISVVFSGESPYCGFTRI